MTGLRAVLAAALLMVMGALAPPAFAQTFPKLTGRVVDGAGVLSAPTEAALTQRLATLEANSGVQLVVATVPSLQGYEIEDYGYRLGRTWGIGQAQEDDGAILLVAPRERRVRIEVGYGLGGRLTDLMSGVILRQHVLPRFREGDMEGGVVAGTNALVNHLSLPPSEARARVVATEDRERSGGAQEDGGGWGGIIIFLVVVFFLLPALTRGGRRRRRRRGMGGVLEAVVWSAATTNWSGGGRGGGGGGGGGFSGGGGSFGGGGASGSW